MRVLAFTLVFALAAAPAQKQPGKAAPASPHNKNLIFWTMSRRSVDMLLSGIPQSNALRLAQLRQTFSDMQCRAPHLRESAAPDGKNLVCTLTGADPAKYGSILFLADYEHEGTGESAVANWSGALMLPFLYHALSAMPRHHTFLFAEVKGEPGARALFDSLTPAQRGEIQGVIALDALGLGPAQFYINPNDGSAANAWARLKRPLWQAAADQRMSRPPDFAIPGAWRKTDTTRVFRHHGLPAMLIHSVDFAARQIPGSAKDTSAAINRDTYFQTLTLLSDYAAELDRPFDAAHR